MSYAQWRAATAAVAELRRTHESSQEERERQRRARADEREREEQRARQRDREAQVQEDQAERAARSQALASLPFLGDDVFVVIATHMDVQGLGRLECAAARFWRKTVAGGAAGAAEVWSVANEAARRQLSTLRTEPRTVGFPFDGRGTLPWLRQLRRAELWLGPLRFSQVATGVTVSEDGARV